MSNRQELETREAAARDKGDGWVGEFVFVIPMFILMAIVWWGSLVGMHYIEWGTLF
ncbi:hypothetical protein G7Y31_04550 [Corynebacterium lizhenjunii]|uniref:Uncharacterized protein n=1 Tax=Corynebacterium lizhenjunii TaxID=2709394 RepID=A0A7T0PCQ1_9CORY|nr:hypothetical protein [Corynebacterium lizhenjunii]QPK79967.1 hypothetical protein G7Y31_04550 [Corynebacterium lizhenjunii]